MESIFLKNKDKIESWLKEYGILTEFNHCELLPDKKYGYVVNVDGHVLLYNSNLTHIPVKFNIVSEQFDCSKNKLTNLEFAPKSVSDFYCTENNLKSLKGCPTEIYGNFWCSDNNLISLKHKPLIVNGEFNCEGNEKLGDLQKIKKLEEITKYMAFKNLNNTINNGNIITSIRKNKI